MLKRPGIVDWASLHLDVALTEEIVFRGLENESGRETSFLRGG